MDTINILSVCQKSCAKYDCYNRDTFQETPSVTAISWDACSGAVLFGGACGLVGRWSPQDRSSPSATRRLLLNDGHPFIRQIWNASAEDHTYDALCDRPNWWEFDHSINNATTLVDFHQRLIGNRNGDVLFATPSRGGCDVAIFFWTAGRWGRREYQIAIFSNDIKKIDVLLTGRPTVAAWSGGHQYVAIGFESGLVEVRDARSLRSLPLSPATLTRVSGSVTGIAWSNADTYLAYCGIADQVVSVVDVVGGGAQQITVSQPFSLSFSMKSDLLAIKSRLGTISVWKREAAWMDKTSQGVDAQLPDSPHQAHGPMAPIEFHPVQNKLASHSLHHAELRVRNLDDCAA